MNSNVALLFAVESHELIMSTRLEEQDHEWDAQRLPRRLDYP